MKVIFFLDYYDEKELLGASVAAYSIQMNGGLPRNTQYILYSWNSVDIEKHIFARFAFDNVLPPPFGNIWENVPEWHPHKYDEFSIATWSKFLSWIYTPSNGEPVFLVDNDILCLGSIQEAIPPEGKLFSGRRRREYNGTIAEGCNGGFYCKAPDFDGSDAPDLMTQPLFSRDAFDGASAMWRDECTDELGMLWYFKQKGYDTFYELAPKFNYVTRWIVDGEQDVFEKNIRMLHYMGKNKPWNRVAKEYGELKRYWEIYQSKVLEETIVNHKEKRNG